MRRKRIELADIAAWDNLQLAVFKAARGKRTTPAITSYLNHLDSRIARLHQDILTARVPYGDYRTFVIHDPKRRTIHAACFAGRV